LIDVSEKPRDFWSAVGLADVKVLKALFNNSLDEHVEAIADDYGEARKLGSPREFSSSMEQIDFFI